MLAKERWKIADEGDAETLILFSTEAGCLVERIRHWKRNKYDVGARWRLVPARMSSPPTRRHGPEKENRYAEKSRTQPECRTPIAR